VANDGESKKGGGGAGAEETLLRGLLEELVHMTVTIKDRKEGQLSTRPVDHMSGKRGRRHRRKRNLGGWGWGGGGGGGGWGGGVCFGGLEVVGVGLGGGGVGSLSVPSSRREGL